MSFFQVWISEAARARGHELTIRSRAIRLREVAINLKTRRRLANYCRRHILCLFAFRAFATGDRPGRNNGFAFDQNVRGADTEQRHKRRIIAMPERNICLGDVYLFIEVLSEKLQAHSRRDRQTTKVESVLSEDRAIVGFAKIRPAQQSIFCIGPASVQATSSTPK